jgi:DNA repair exonuclease SbcCD ATPase subunit
MQGQPGQEERWEHWPGRRRPDDGVRHRLRSLFVATDETEAVEAMIAEHGKELEAQTEQLAATISDLERREQRARELAAAVERMLRHGSAELDERHAELNKLAEELTRREEAIGRTEQEIADRRREAGAVELRRAAAERREAAVAERETALERIAGELQERHRGLAEAERRAEELAARETTLHERAAELDQLAEDLQAVERALAEREAALAATVPAAVAAEGEHVRFVPGIQYLVETVEGPAPPIGTPVDVAGAQLTVVRVGPSPFPGDRRRCAYLGA